MQRFTISIDGELASQFEELLRRKGYENRSEAVRDLVRADLVAAYIEQDEAPFCMVAVSYVYSHRTSTGLAELQHEHHDIVLCAMHVHLAHDDCLETLILRGATEEVRKFAQMLIAQAGVRHGQFHLVPVDIDREHSHHDGAHGTDKGHVISLRHRFHSKPRI